MFTQIYPKDKGTHCFSKSWNSKEVHLIQGESVFPDEVSEASRGSILTEAKAQTLFSAVLSYLFAF